MNILSKLISLPRLDIAKPLLGVVIEGNVPMIMLAGLLSTLLMKKYSVDSRKVMLIIAVFGIASLVAGFILRNWFIISKIQATPSWGLICNGISMMLFVLLYYIIDVKQEKRWTSFIKPAGENSLTTYLAPDILYYLIWMSGIPVQFYKHSADPLVIIAGSLAWALLMVALTALLVRFGIRLKL